MNSPGLSFEAEFGFFIPGTSTEVECIFSVIFNTWTAEKGQMTLATLEAILNIKFNSEMTCAEFYKANKNDKDMFIEVFSNEKY